MYNRQLFSVPSFYSRQLSPVRHLHDFSANPGELLALTRRAFSRMSDIATPFPVSVEKKEDGFILQAELPGVPRDAIDVSLMDNELSITINKMHTSSEQNFLINERSLMTEEVTRRFQLNDEIDENSLKAHLKDGVLTLLFKNKEKPEAKKVEIQETAPDSAQHQVHID